MQEEITQGAVTLIVEGAKMTADLLQMAMEIFQNSEFGSIRVIEENGNYLFCGFDVSKALRYAKPRNALNTHCKGALKRGALTVFVQGKYSGNAVKNIPF